MVDKDSNINVNDGHDSIKVHVYCRQDSNKGQGNNRSEWWQIQLTKNLKVCVDEGKDNNKTVDDVTNKMCREYI